MFLFENILISQNLIQNESFENYTGAYYCNGSVAGGGGFDNYSTFPFEHKVDNWYTLNSSDYFPIQCAVTSSNGVTYNSFGNISPKTGTVYVGFILFQANTEMKEYIYQQLTAPLIGGKTYCLSFYVSRADRTTHAIHSIGAYFSSSTPTMITSYYISDAPQVINNTGFIIDTVQWTQIQGCFTAIGGEQYITIGNFNSNSNTDTLFVGSTDPDPQAYKYGYYYIDDVNLYDPLTVGMSELNNEKNFTILPNPSHGNFTIKSNVEIRKIEISDVTGQQLLSETTSEKTHHLACVNLLF